MFPNHATSSVSKASSLSKSLISGLPLARSFLGAARPLPG